MGVLLLLYYVSDIWWNGNRHGNICGPIIYIYDKYYVAGIIPNINPYPPGSRPRSDTDHSFGSSSMKCTTFSPGSSLTLFALADIQPLRVPLTRVVFTLVWRVFSPAAH